MNESKRKINVEVIPGPRAAAPDPLARSAAVLAGATRVKEIDYDARVRAAQAALADFVNDSKVILAAVEKLWAERGEGLTKLGYVDWASLRLRGVAPELLTRVERLIADVQATFSSARSELQAIPGRVAGLGRRTGLGGKIDDDLELCNFEPLPFQAGGMHQRAPTHIRADLERQRRVTDALREQLATLEYVVQETERRVKNAPPADGVAVTVRRPGDEDQPRQTKADGDFNPLDPNYGRS